MEQLFPFCFDCNDVGMEMKQNETLMNYSNLARQVEYLDLLIAD